MAPTTTIPETQTEATPDAVLQLATGYMASKHLLVANELGIFEQLADGPLALDALAERTGLPRRTLRIVADALASLRVLEREDRLYQNGAVAQRFLTGREPDLRPILRTFERISYPAWMGLAKAVRSGESQTRWGQLSEEDQHVFSAGIEAITAQPADALAATYDFGRHQRLLDVGGGTGSFSIAILDRYPTLRGTLFDLPTTLPAASRRLASSDCAGPIQVVAGDFFKDALPEGHDVVLVANVIHLFTPEHNLELLRRIRQAVAARARLLLVDAWTDAGHTQPLAAALFAGEFLIMGGEGDVYSEAEASAWLRQTGWDVVGHEPLAGLNSLLIAEAVQR